MARKSGRKTRWYSARGGFTLTANGTGFQQLLSNLDPGYQDATIMRIRGVYQFRGTAGSGAFDEHAVGIITAPQAILVAGLPNPRDTAISGDWMWHNWMITNITQLTDQNKDTHVIDNRSQRILRGDNRALFIKMTAGSNHDVELVYGLRTLVMLP